MKDVSESIRKQCVELAKKIARMLANYTCAYCGRKEPDVRTHGSHIYSEGQYKAMSADVDNIFCLCAIHHMVDKWNRSSNWSWHGSPLEAIEWFKEKYPERYKMLKARSKKRVYCDTDYWAGKLIELKDRYNKLQNET